MPYTINRAAHEALADALECRLGDERRVWDRLTAVGFEIRAVDSVDGCEVQASGESKTLDALQNVADVVEARSDLALRPGVKLARPDSKALAGSAREQSHVPTLEAVSRAMWQGIRSFQTDDVLAYGWLQDVGRLCEHYIEVEFGLAQSEDEATNGPPNGIASGP